jgi:hypothetical protein
MDDKTLTDWFESLSQDIASSRQEVKDGFGEVNQRLDRIDNTLVLHGRQLAAGARAIAGFNEWSGKADADYVRVLAELSELKQRVAKLEEAP